MNPDLTRRDFIRSASVATLAAASLPSTLAADKTITLAFVGCAHIHTPGFVNLLKKRQDVKDVDKIWSDPDIAAVVICSETNRHQDLLLAAAKAGKHMFAEKPLGITAKESYAMADAIEKANLLVTTGDVMRTDPMHLFLKD